jgi:hypothetical protein
LAEDSDYFIFGIPYIPLSTISIEKNENEDNYSFTQSNIFGDFYQAETIEKSIIIIYFVYTSRVLISSINLSYKSLF